MFVAVDKSGNRIYADDIKRGTECFCPVCGESLIHKKGKIKRVHFAHKHDTNCFMALDKDRVGEWHLRMQSYFPKESREFRFQDKETGEIKHEVFSDIIDYLLLHR